MNIIFFLEFYLFNFNIFKTFFIANIFAQDSYLHVSSKLQNKHQKVHFMNLILSWSKILKFYFKVLFLIKD